MSPVRWFLCVLAAFAAYFTAARLWNKDNKGAIALAVAVFLVGLLLLSVSGCTVSPERRPWLEAGLAYDTQSTVGNNPACIVRLRAPIGFGPIPPDWLVLGYQHISSCPDLFDANTIDAVEVMAKIPLGRDR